MNPTLVHSFPQEAKIQPLCPVFGTCGGCAYQDLSYDAELQLKEKQLKQLLMQYLEIPETVFDPITASPQNYHYRHRLDLSLKRSQGQILFGFQSPAERRMVPIETCAIAMKAVSNFIPKLREEAIAKMPVKYRTANIVVRTGDDGRVFWGGIGRRSLEMKEGDYLWTEIEGKKIFYSLETFFQANLSILPSIVQKIRWLAQFDSRVYFLDLYSGVGLFGLCFANDVRKVLMIEDCPGSVKLARYNVKYHDFAHIEIRSGRVEEELPFISVEEGVRPIAMIDPPRQGLSQQVAESLSREKRLESLLYLSCHPESLARDLKIFVGQQWKIVKVAPFDFFPRTQHLETLVLLKP